MHKAIILLTQVENKKQAKENVLMFMKKYGGNESCTNIWDWYEIGGRFNNLLNPDKGGNILPLEEAKDKVNNSKQDHIKEGNKYLEKGIEHLKHFNYDLGGLKLETASKFFLQDFHNKVNIYNIVEENYSIPTNIKGWYAVMIDMHY